MSQELGKVEKPEVSSFKHDRKILQVPPYMRAKNPRRNSWNYLRILAAGK